MDGFDQGGARFAQVAGPNQTEKRLLQIWLCALDTHGMDWTLEMPSGVCWLRPAGRRHVLSRRRGASRTGLPTTEGSAMKRYVMTAVATASVAGVSAGASASIVVGTSYQVEEAALFNVSFVSQNAGWAGSLYFIGAEMNGVMHHAEDTDGMGVGQFLFDNHGTSSGFTAPIGEFDAGAVLHFGYLVYSGSKANGNVRYIHRTDSVGSKDQFAWQELSTIGDESRRARMHVEDIHGSGSDWDYNDLRADIVAHAVPTPGAISLTGFAMVLCVIRRRKADD